MGKSHKMGSFHWDMIPGNALFPFKSLPLLILGRLWTAIDNEEFGGVWELLDKLFVLQLQIPFEGANIPWLGYIRIIKGDGFYQVVSYIHH